MGTSQEETTRDAEFSSVSAVCTWCNSPVPHSTPFKTCRGCTDVVYCSRECRAAAWPAHKLSCRSRNPPAGERTGRTGVSPRQTVKEWAELHKYALTVLAHSTLRLPRGVKANLRRGRVLVFVVGLAPPSEPATSPVAADQNPATTFTLWAVKLVEAEHAPPLPNPEAPELSRLAPELSRLASEFDEPGFRGDYEDTHATPAGYVPVCFELGGAVAFTTQYAVYRASHHSDDTELEDKTVRMFKDVTSVFVALINHGFVARPPSDSEGPVALPDGGRMVRARNGWRWQQDPRARALMADIPLQTSYSLTGLWTRFQQW